MNSLIKKYQNELVQAVEELKKLPVGHLTKKQTYFYHVVKSKEFGITRKPELIQQFCRKKYLLVRKAELEKVLKRPFEKFQLSSPHEIIPKLPKAYQNVPVIYFYHPAVGKWLEKSHRQNTIDLEKAKYIFDGIAFRSMSERMIAEQLASFELPYKYDTIANFNVYETFSPDFIIKNPFTDKTVVWEHFGAFDKEKYAIHMNDKMDKYLKHGYIENENLIVTFEYHLRDLERIKTLIRKIIL